MWEAIQIKFRYRPVVATDIDSNVTCSDSLPIITSFKPKHGYGPIAAGIKDTLIINGLNFTDTGSVWFRNADTLVKYGRVYEYDIMKWNDTLIELVLPGTLYPDNGPPGTGEFFMKNGNGDTASSPEEIDIPFCAGSVRGLEYDVRFYLSDVNNNGGIDLFIDSSFYNINMGEECIRSALDEWRCNTLVNFILKDSIVDIDPTDLIDSVSSISFVPPSMMSNPNKIAETYSIISDRTAICSGPNSTIGRHVFEVDILVRNDINWFIDTLTSIGNNQRVDLISTLVHELGHAHLLKHALKDDKIMYFLIPRDTIKRSVDQDDILGGRTILEDGRSQIYFSCDYNAMEDSIFSFCTFPNGVANKMSKQDILIYPNPTSNSFIIESIEKQHIKSWVNVYDSKGRRVISEKMKTSRKSIDIRGLAKGLYIVRLTSLRDGFQYSTKLLIQ